MKRYVERNGWGERVWKVTYNRKGFEFVIYVRGTEPEMHDYMTSELGDVGRYHAISEEQQEMVSKLGQKIYIAPKLEDQEDGYY